MKTLLLLVAISITIFSCGTGNTINNTATEVSKNDTLKIVNEALDYEIIIVEPGFDSWLLSQPPRGFYGQTKLESKNRMFVSEYNSRVMQPNQYSPGLYAERINYEPTVDYGYEVNYLLYNYFVYFQEEYDQNFIAGRN